MIKFPISSETNLSARRLMHQDMPSELAFNAESRGK